VDVQPQPIGTLPGVVFTVKAVLRNYSGVAVNASMTITLAGQGGKLLNALPLTSMKPQTTIPLTATWDSTGKAPNVYRIDAFAPTLKNESITDHNPNLKSVWIQLVYSQPTGGLSLLGAAGITVVAAGAGGYGVSFLRRRKPDLDDAL
jgi:hypothetical protein